MLLGFLLVECTNTEGVVERLRCLEMSVLVLGFFCQSFWCGQVTKNWDTLDCDLYNYQKKRKVDLGEGSTAEFF